MKREILWAITKEGLATVQDIRDQVAAHRGQVKASIAKRPKEDIYGQPIEQMRLERGVAIIPINGPMAPCEPIDKLFGMVSYEDILEDLQTAQETARGAILKFDSPGGSVLGLMDVSARVVEMRNTGFQVVSFTSGLQCSAAYHIGAGASILTATRSSIVGSIGTISEMVEFSKMLQDNGVAVRQFSSGKYKGAGSPYIPPTEDHLKWFQNRVDYFSTEFFEHVLSNRPAIDSETMQGQWFSGNEALDNDLIDQVVRDLREVLALF